MRHQSPARIVVRSRHELQHVGGHSGAETQLGDAVRAVATDCGAGLRITDAAGRERASTPPAGMANGKFHGGATTIVPSADGRAPVDPGEPDALVARSTGRSRSPQRPRGPLRSPSCPPRGPSPRGSRPRFASNEIGDAFRISARSLGAQIPPAGLGVRAVDSDHVRHRPGPRRRGRRYRWRFGECLGDPRAVRGSCPVGVGDVDEPARRPVANGRRARGAVGAALLVRRGRWSTCRRRLDRAPESRPLPGRTASGSAARSKSWDRKLSGAVFSSSRRTRYASAAGKSSSLDDRRIEQRARRPPHAPPPTATAPCPPASRCRSGRVARRRASRRAARAPRRHRTGCGSPTPTSTASSSETSARTSSTAL